jgi:hypothetical protein
LARWILRRPSTMRTGCVESPEVVTQTGRAGRVAGEPQVWIVDEAEAKQS